MDGWELMQGRFKNTLRREGGGVRLQHLPAVRSHGAGVAQGCSPWVRGKK